MKAKRARAILRRYRLYSCTPDEKLLVENWYRRLRETGKIRVSLKEMQRWRIRIEKRLQDAINRKTWMD